MDDLNGLDWSQPAKQPATTPAAFPPFRQSPTPQLSGRSTPLSGLSTQQSGGAQQPRPFKASSKPATPANDSFAGLISGKTSKPAGSGLSLQERQKQLQEEKQRRLREQLHHLARTTPSASRHCPRRSTSHSPASTLPPGALCNRRLLKTTSSLPLIQLPQ